MNWFNKNHSVCKVCGVHFEPVSGYEAEWGDLCQVHRKPVMELALKKRSVMRWADANWEQVLKIMEVEDTANNRIRAGNVAGQENTMAAQMAASNSYVDLGVLGGGNFYNSWFSGQQQS